MKILLAVLLSAGVLLGQTPAGPAQGPAPKSLTKQPDGHISANAAPANAEKFETHVVQSGETLSGIAEAVLKDSRLWPQLWEQNEHIINPHWIYPNDKILIRPITKITEAAPPSASASAPLPVAAQSLPQPAPPQRGTAVIRPALVVPPVVTAKAQDVIDLPAPRVVPEMKSSDLYCSGFVRATPVPKTLRVASTYQRDTAVFSAEGNYVRVSAGSSNGVTAGSIFQVVRPTRTVDDPSRKGATKSLGKHYLDIGQIQVIQVQGDSALARVTANCEAIEVGDLMIPFVHLDVPKLPYPRAFSSTMTTAGQLKGSVVLMKNEVLRYGSASGSLAAEGDVVYVDLGKGDGVKSGDLFIVYRGKAAIGEIAILKVDEWVATALVTYSTDALVPGDRVERR